MLKHARQSGFTLAELMIALVINAMIFIGLISIFVANLTHYTSALNINRLNQQLAAAMEIMATDIRRAGYWSSAYTNIGTNQNTNPFMSSTNGTDIAVGSPNSCITFTYDHNKTGTLPSVSSAADDDRYGYRLNNNTLQTRPWGASFICSAGSNAWENMLDPSIVVTALSFTLNSQTVTTGPGVIGLTMRSVDISMTAHLASNTAVVKTLTQHVRISNDYFVP